MPGVRCETAKTKKMFFILNLPFMLVGILLTLVGLLAISRIGKFGLLTETSATNVFFVLIIFSVLIFVFSFLGIYGTIRDNRKILLTYSSLMCILSILNLILIISSFVGKNLLTSDEKMKDTLMDSIDEYNVTKKVKEAWDITQRIAECCGVDNYTDWGENIPESCCRKKEVEKCPEKDLFKDGCWDKMLEIFGKYYLYLGISSILILILPVLLTTFACCLARNIKEEHYEEKKQQRREEMHKQLQLHLQLLQLQKEKELQQQLEKLEAEEEQRKKQKEQKH